MIFFKKITCKQVLTLHQKAINDYGGDSTILNEGLIESALNFLYLEEFSIPEIAGKLSYRLLINHAFLDGNKRTAFATAKLFLDFNGYKYTGRKVDAIRIITGVADTSKNENDIMAHFCHNSSKKQTC